MSFAKYTGTIDNNFGCKSKALSEQSILTLAISPNGLAPTMNYINNATIWVKIDGSYLKQDKVLFTHGNVVTFFVYELHIAYLELLSWLTMLILINILILDMTVDLIHDHFFNSKFWLV